MILEILTPEHKIFTGEVQAITMPGKDGLFQVLNNHAAMISSLKEGKVKIQLSDSYKKMGTLHESIQVQKGEDRNLYLAINGGVAEVNDNKVILLAS